jgi:hypothetical protein
VASIASRVVDINWTLKKRFCPKKNAFVQNSTSLSAGQCYPASEDRRLRCVNKASNNQSRLTIFGPGATCGWNELKDVLVTTPPRL